MAANRKGWLPPREGGYKAAARTAKKATAGRSKPVPPKGGSGVSRPTNTTKE
jgi:hypothetical protein